MFDFIDEI